MSQPPDDHLKALWQGQDTETPAMTAIAIRALARNYGDTLRGRIWLGLGLGAVELLMFGTQAVRAKDEVLRIGWLIMIVSVGWLIWRIVRKSPRRMPPPAASTQALIEFHRGELVRQRTGPAWIAVSTAPLFAGMVVTLVGLQRVRPNMSLVNLAPVAILTVVWCVWAAILNRRQTKRLDAQIAEMDDLRRG